MDEITRLEKTAWRAAERATEEARRQLNLATPGTSKWRVRDQSWQNRYFAECYRAELEKRHPQIERTRRKLARLSS